MAYPLEIPRTDETGAKTPDVTEAKTVRSFGFSK